MVNVSSPESPERPAPGPPLLSPASALFLDFDGTLVAIASDPGAVQPDPGLGARLTRLHRALDGALAIVSGRRIAEIDAHLGGARLFCAGLHGWERRSAAGLRRSRALPAARLRALRDRLANFARDRPGVVVEDKGAGIALHYRKAPAEAAACAAVMQQLAAGVTGLRLRQGHCVWELAPAGADKGRAVRAFLREAPFAGRLPFYLGDDITDEDAFRALRASGGVAVAVGDRPGTAASFALPSVAAVHDWLDRSARHLAARRPPKPSAAAPGGMA